MVWVLPQTVRTGDFGFTAPQPPSESPGRILASKPDSAYSPGAKVCITQARKVFPPKPKREAISPNTLNWTGFWPVFFYAGVRESIIAAPRIRPGAPFSPTT